MEAFCHARAARKYLSALSVLLFVLVRCAGECSGHAGFVVGIDWPRLARLLSASLPQECVYNSSLSNPVAGARKLIETIVKKLKDCFL